MRNPLASRAAASGGRARRGAMVAMRSPSTRISAGSTRAAPASNTRPPWRRITDGSPPERSPQSPVHGGVLVHGGGVQLLLRELLLNGELLVLLVGLLIARVEALAELGIGVDVIGFAVPGMR